LLSFGSALRFIIGGYGLDIARAAKQFPGQV
jgi:hypothetical protein